MYITEMLMGRPYQCFIPRPVIPVVGPRYLRAFAEIDRKCLASRDEGDIFMASAIEFVARVDTKRSSDGRVANVAKMVANTLARNQIGITQLKKINAELVGRDEQGFRTGPVWVGAPHPALSWHVGSPPGQLKALIKQCLSLPEMPMPSTMQALMGLIRLMQIHPFNDGNGRTARLYALWLGCRRLGASDRLLQLLSILTNRARFDLNAASLDVQNTGRFDLLFEYLINADAQLRAQGSQCRDGV